MSYMSRNDSSTSLMGFSVHQPAIGAPLQFFPAMGSKQLDEMIDAYVPGDASIIDKRAAVSMEFFEHSMTTGELFKFFMVYPSLGSTTESPSSVMLDSGYVSNFTSPVMSESQWTQSSGASFSSESGTRKSSPRKAAPSADFSHLPGMKILTKDGKDVTNSASRGCKTKEQRDHAHLMRIIKACESCRKKKVRCDPSHKRSAGSSGARTAKKAKKVAAPSVPASAPPPQTALEPSEQHLSMPSFDLTNFSSSSFDSATSESLIDPTMDWDQFVQYDEESAEAIPYDYNFFFGPADYLTPTSSNSFSPSQPITPTQTLGVENAAIGTIEGEVPELLPPYLYPGGEAGNNYADFNLYSPGSLVCLDDDPSLITEISAIPRLDYSECPERPSDQQLPHVHGWRNFTGHDRGLDTQPNVTVFAEYQALPISREREPLPADLHTSLHHSGAVNIAPQSLDGTGRHGLQANHTFQDPVPASRGGSNVLSLPSTDELRPRPRPPLLSVVSNVSPARLDAASSRLRESLRESLPITSPSTGEVSSSFARSTSQQHSIALPTRSSDTAIAIPASLAASNAVAAELPSVDQSPRECNRPPRSVVHLDVLQEGLISGRPQKIVVPSSEQSASRSSSIQGYTSDRAVSSPLSSPVITQPIPAPITRSAARDARERPPCARTSRPVSQNITVSSAIEMAGLSGTSPSTPLSMGSETVFSGVVVLGVTTVALYALPLLLFAQGVPGEQPYIGRKAVLPASSGPARRQVKPYTYIQLRPIVCVACLLALALLRDALLSRLRQRQLHSGEVGEVGMLPVLVGSLFIAVAYAAVQQHTITCVPILSLAARPLSFVRRIPISATKAIETRYSRLLEAISRSQCGFKRIISLQPSNRSETQVPRLQRLTNLAWR